VMYEPRVKPSDPYCQFYTGSYRLPIIFENLSDKYPGINNYSLSFDHEVNMLLCGKNKQWKLSHTKFSSRLLSYLNTQQICVICASHFSHKVFFIEKVYSVSRFD
jgi:hypothetical protein